MTNPLQRKVILAIDGGGSKTEAWIADSVTTSSSSDVDFRVLGRGIAGPANPRAEGFEKSFAQLEQALRSAADNAKLDRFRCDVACVSLAGAGRLDEQRRVSDWFQQLQLAERVIVVDDVAPLRLAAAYEYRRANDRREKIDDADAWDRCITLVAGTGSIAYASDKDQVAARAGGWGYLLGDQGSGFAIGLSALRSICHAHDRGIELSVFQQSLLRQFKLDEPTKLIDQIYQHPIPRPAIAKLSEIVIGFAEHDPVARKIANRAVSDWARHIAILMKRLGFGDGEYALAMSGGILKNHPNLVMQLLRELTLRRLSPRCSHVVSQPIHGPLMMASVDVP